MVNVARRMGPGMNSPGGLGHVVRVYSVRTAPDGTAAAADAASGGDRRGRRGGAGEGGSITYTVDCVDARPARMHLEIRDPSIDLSGSDLSLISSQVCRRLKRRSKNHYRK